jgi:uncharacterized protein
VANGVNSLSKALIVFMRYPERGKVKSRLAEEVGTEEAYRVYRMLCRRTLGIAADFRHENPDVRIFVSFTPRGKQSQLQQEYPGPWTFVPQAGTHLGDRMGRAFDSVLSAGFRHAVLIGTDLADLQTMDIEQAFRTIEGGSAVLGPARDGGFYLIGLDRPCPSALSFRDWGTNQIHDRTSRALMEAGLSVGRTAVRRDVDRIEDLAFLRQDTLLRGRLSVIVPTLGPPEMLEAPLDRLLRLLWPDDEIIVVEGREGARPQVQEISGQMTHLLTGRGRGLQLDCAAQRATGDVLLFLHDDSTAPDNFAYVVRKILQAPESSLGCFQLRFSPQNKTLEMVAKWANLRTNLLKLPYGDQGLFCRREVFRAAGGFRRRYLMEDVDFVKHCRQLGRLLILPDEIVTSPQRYLSKGVLRASLQNHCIMLLYRLGVPDRKLYSLYYR